MILLIDNYDSFSYNLVQLVGTIRPDIQVVRNDEKTVEEIRQMKPTHIILSPGPGYPQNAGICEDVVKKLQGEIPILGVCLGHQAICEAYGSTIAHAKRLMHGKRSRIEIDTDSAVFKQMEKEMEAARYHSLVAKEETIPEELEIIARTSEGEVMAVQHKTYPVFGLQFHPESILTTNGEQIIRNFLNIKIKAEDKRND